MNIVKLPKLSDELQLLPFQISEEGISVRYYELPDAISFILST